MVLVLSPLVVFPLAIAACGAGSSAEGSDTTRVTGPATTISPPGSTNVSSSPEAEVFFPELKESQLTPLLSLIGKLIVGREGCIRVNDPTFDQGDPGYIPLWPTQYELDADGDDARILEGRGQIVARLAKRSTCGGEIDRATLEGRNFLGERVMRELFERWLGRYWLVSDGEVKIPQQE